MHLLVARLALRTGLAPDVVADLEPTMFDALAQVCGFGGDRGVL